MGACARVMRARGCASGVDLQYELPLVRSPRRVRALNGYVNVGVYVLSDFDDLAVAVPGFVGASRIPIDLTFDIGLRMDTRVGVFKIGFSSVLGLIAL